MIQTESSFLKVYPFDGDTLLSNCVNEITDKLILNPPIKVYGKDCIQHRSIGFFSDTSIGYYYSGKLAKSQKLTTSLQELLDLVNQKFSANFNGSLISKKVSPLIKIKSFLILFFNKSKAPPVSLGLFSIIHLIFVKL
mgnify:CR=1 FL=1